MKKKMLGIFATVMLALLTMCPGTGRANEMPVETGSTLYQKPFDDWTALVVRFNSGVTFRAMTSSENANGTSAVVISFAAGNCDSYTADLVTVSTAANEQDYSGGGGIPVAARVDNKPILTGKIVGSVGNFGETDGAALDCLLEAQEMLAQALTPEEFAGLTREVQNFAFDAALVELRAIIARFGTAAEGGDGAALSAALSQLETMLAEGNGAALDCALAAQELLERALGAQEAGALLREVNNFDFDAALVRVRTIAARG
jgi:hypothetical protein